MSSSTNFTLQIKDSANNTESLVTTVVSAMDCSEVIITGSTRTISKSPVSLSFMSNSTGLSFGLTEVLLTISACGSNCAECANNIYCFVCAGSYVLLNNQCATGCGSLFVQMQGSRTFCVAACSDQFFPSIQNSVRNCQACISPCLTCLNATSCLSCVAGQDRFYDDLQNACLGVNQNCSAGFFKDTTAFVCAKCITPCLTCDSSVNCLSCAVGFFKDNICLGTCPSGYFANQANSRCDICAAICATCSNSAANCLSCHATDSRFLLNSQCLSGCPSGYYTLNGSECRLCHPSCSTCTGSG